MLESRNKGDEHNLSFLPWEEYDEELEQLLQLSDDKKSDDVRKEIRKLQTAIRNLKREHVRCVALLRFKQQRAKDLRANLSM